MRVAVVGGGVAGLATAYFLERRATESGRSLDCTLVEADHRLGGKVVTHEESGFVIEGGPDSFLTQKPWAIDLCRKLGLGDQIVPTNDASRRVFILWRHRLHRLPDGVLLIVPTRLQPFVFSSLITPLGKLRMGMDLVIPARRDRSDESVGDFVRRRLGGEALEKIAEPLMGGIHVSDPDRQSLLGTFPRFADLEAKHGSLIRGMLAGRGLRPSNGKTPPMFVTLKDGLEVLIKALDGHTGRTRKLLGRRATWLNVGPSGGYRLDLDDGSRLDADALVLAVPARDAASLVDDLDPELASKLWAIRYVTTATVSLGYRQGDVGRPLDGFGFVIPRREQRSITACTWSSTKFDARAPGGMVLLRCFLGGATNEAPALLPEDEMVRLAREELGSLMGITAEPALVKVFRWLNGHPQYDVGHLDLVADLERMAARHPGLHLTGSSYRGVGLPDCVHNAEITASALLEQAAIPA